MTFTTAQKDVIKADIIASVDMQGLPSNEDGSYAIAALYNQTATPDYWVWNTAALTKNLMDAVTWANMTPQDAPDGTATWTNRALACQGKQFNLQTMLVGRETVDGSKVNIRAGLQDALSSIPSGAAGALKSGGWAAVKLALARKATRLEKLLASGNGDVATPSTLTYEGSVGYQEIGEARA